MSDTPKTPVFDSSPASSTASPPFHGSASSDVVLRTSDKVDFHVHKVILALASPLFETMFTLPQPCTDFVSPKPIVDITETSTTIDIILRMCYPTVPKGMAAIACIVDVLVAALKYEMAHVLFAARAAFREVVQSGRDPLRAWALACARGEALEEEAQFAAQAWRTRGYTCDHESVREIDALSGLVYRRLTYFRHGFTVASFCGPPTGDAPSHPPIKITSTSPFRFKDADIVLRVGDGVTFNVHSLILTLTSTPLANMVVKAKRSGVREGGFPVIDFTEDSDTVWSLFFLCYPGTNGSPEISNFYAARRLLLAGERYAVERVAVFVKGHIAKYMEEKPLLVYFLAAARGWNALARQSAFTWLQRQGEYDILPSAWGKGSLIGHDDISDWELRDISSIHFRELCALFTTCSRKTHTLYQAAKKQDKSESVKDYVLWSWTVEKAADEVRVYSPSVVPILIVPLTADEVLRRRMMGFGTG